MPLTPPQKREFEVDESACVVLDLPPPGWLWTMRRDGDLDPRLVVERRAARGRRLRRMALPCVFLGQLLLFVTYVYCSYPNEERPRHSQEAAVEQVPLGPFLAEHPARLAADASAPSESAAAEAAERPVAAANDPMAQWPNAAVTAETEAAAKAMSATETVAVAETAQGAGRAESAEPPEPRGTVAAARGTTEEVSQYLLAAEDEDEETVRRRREDAEDDEAMLTPPGQEAAPNRTWAGLRGRCLEKAKGFWTYQVCVGEGVQQFHYTSSHGVAEQTRARLGFYAAALDVVTPRSQRYTEGDMCKLTKVPRETTVHYTCGQTDQLQRVEEPAPCVYELHATVRAACEPAAEALRDGGEPGARPSIRVTNADDRV